MSELFIPTLFLSLFPGSKAKGDDITVTWDNPEELEAYIVKLQAAADRLTSENRRLRKSHQIIQDKVRTMISFFLRKQNLNRKALLNLTSPYLLTSAAGDLSLASSPIKE